MTIRADICRMQLSLRKHLQVCMMVMVLVIGGSGISCGSSSFAIGNPPSPTLTWDEIEATYVADPCNPPPEIEVDEVVEGNVLTWVDNDIDGVIDDNEPPLLGVQFGIGYTDQVTDSQGRGTAWTLRAGCACDCWMGEVMVVDTPDGFEPTTPTELPLMGYNETYLFGFRPVEEPLPSSGKY